MEVTFTHILELSSRARSHSMNLCNGNIEWTVHFTSNSGCAIITLSSEPRGEITCPIMLWSIVFDVTYTCIRMEKGDKLRWVRKKQEVVTNDVLCYEDMRANSDHTFVEVKVEISNIRATGLQLVCYSTSYYLRENSQFERKVFENPISNEDLVLNVNGEKLHCHSQILSWNSKVFKAVIQKRLDPAGLMFQPISDSRASCEIFLEEGIPVEDLRELLHYIYFPLEAVDEHNFRQLLHWGKKFEVNHIVQLCQQFMESVLRNPITTEEGKLEIFLLSWKYFVEPLKVVSGEVVFPSKPPDLMSTLSKCEIYQSTKETEKLEMWNFLFGKLYSY